MCEHKKTNDVQYIIQWPLKHENKLNKQQWHVTANKQDQLICTSCRKQSFKSSLNVNE